MRHFSIYTDGACSGNPGRGGWGAVIIDENDTVLSQLSCGYQLTTNNRMEILGVAEALAKIAKNVRNADEITVYSDSQLVVETMNKGWKKKTNLDLWHKLDEAIACLKSKGINDVRFVKVKGHSDNKWNNLVDRIAVDASQPINAKTVDTEYEKTQKEETANKEIKLKNAKFIGYDTPENRKIEAELTNGSVITIVPCWGGWQSTGGTEKEFVAVVDLAEESADWLNGLK